MSYRFNLDGTNIYMTPATLFLAQATNPHLSATQTATLLILAMLTSKGATGVTGAGFIVLAAQLFGSLQHAAERQVAERSRAIKE